MKIVLYKPLVRPEYRFDAFWSQYLGFSYLKAYCLGKAPNLSIVVVYTMEEIVYNKPDIVGISSVTEMWEVTKDLILWLRNEGFSGPIIVGGPHITVLPQTLPKQADCAVLGQGEQTFLELLNAYGVNRYPILSQIPGIAFRNSDGQLICTGKRQPIDIDCLPVDVSENPAAWFQISTVRGCPFHCFHCVEHKVQGNVSFLSAEKLLWIMKNRLEATGNPHFFFQDDTFLAAKDRLKKLYELTCKEGLLGKFMIHSVSLNANLVEEDTIPLLKEMGVLSLGMGVESLNPRILGVMKCNSVKVEDIDKTIHYAQKVGLPIGGSQVYGFPGEKREEMIDSIRRVRHYEFTTGFRHWVCYVCQPLPGSKLWEEEMGRAGVSADMDFSCLRIDGDCRYFNTPWYYGNEENVPRDEFLSILKKYGMLAKNFFLPPSSNNQEDSYLSKVIDVAGKRAYKALSKFLAKAVSLI